MEQTSTLATLLKRYRKAAGLTQAELAERAGLSAVYVGMIEGGRRVPHPSTIEALAAALRLDAAQQTAIEAACRAAALATLPAAAPAHKPPTPSPAVGTTTVDRPAPPFAPPAPTPVPPALPALPVPPTPLVGREHEVAAGGALLTRLALRIAQDAAPLYADGVVFVALAALADASLVAPTIATTLGLRDTDQAPRDALATSVPPSQRSAYEAVVGDVRPSSATVSRQSGCAVVPCHSTIPSKRRALCRSQRVCEKSSARRRSGVIWGRGRLHLDEELTLLATRLSNPEPFLAYLHGDACPDNCVHIGDTVRLFDFEHGRFGPALINGVYGRLPFPSCWCIGRLPEPVARDMEEMYRAALSHGCPAATDDTLFYRAVVEACVYWLAHFARLHPLAELLERDSLWDTATMRQRCLLRIDGVDRALREVAHLGAIGALIATIAVKLHTL